MLLPLVAPGTGSVTETGGSGRLAGAGVSGLAGCSWPLAAAGVPGLPGSWNGLNMRMAFSNIAMFCLPIDSNCWNGLKPKAFCRYFRICSWLRANCVIDISRYCGTTPCRLSP
jgi:hypothetical protein